MRYGSKPYNGETLEQLLANGYARVSNKYRTISRVDRHDWLKRLAKHLHRSVAELYIEGTDTISPHWCDYWRRCMSEDSIEGVPPEIFQRMPLS